MLQVSPPEYKPEPEPGQSKITRMLQGESMLYGKQAADILPCTCKEASDITVFYTNKQKFAENNETSKYQMIYLILWTQLYRWKS